MISVGGQGLDGPTAANEKAPANRGLPYGVHAASSLT